MLLRNYYVKLFNLILTSEREGWDHPIKFKFRVGITSIVIILSFSCLSNLNLNTSPCQSGYIRIVSPGFLFS